MDEVATSSRSNVDNEYTRDYTGQFTAAPTFKSKEELIKWAKEVGRSNNITVVVLRSDSGKGKKKPRVTLGCEKSGKCDTRNTPKKPMTDMIGRGTKKCDCPFRLMGKKLPAGDEWELMVVQGKHNHEAEDTIGKQGHSFQGRLSQEEKSLVKDWRETGKQPKEILEDLKKRDTHNKSTARTIYNECQRLERIKRIEDQISQVQLLTSGAEKHNFIQKHRTSPKMDTALDLFLTHRTSLELLLAFPTVLKIQREWGPPSWTTLEILGVTSTGINFFVALAITSRDGSSYEWALSSLRGVMNGYGIAMPHVVILEIYEEGVIQLAPMKKAINDVFSTPKVLLPPDTIDSWVRHYYGRVTSNFNYEERYSFFNKWELLVASPTEADLEQRITQLRTEFYTYPKTLDYVTHTLLKPYKDMFVAAWTDKVMHFGSNKWTWLRGSDYIYLFFSFMLPIQVLGVGQTVGTDKVLNDLQGLIENENAKVKASFKESLENEYKDQYGFPELKELYGTISIHALRLIRKQQTIVVDAGENCSCAIRSTHGLPCAHQIAKYRREGRPIPPECINSHWRTLQLKPLRETGEPSVEGRVKRRKLSDEKNTDTHSVPALPDIVESERNSPNAGPSIVPSTQDRQPDVEVYDIQSTKLLELVDVSPPVLRTYVLEVKDVPRDGHCGFSAIASLLGITDDDGRLGWVKVRKDLEKELKFNPVHYAHLFGSKHEVDNLLHRLDYFLIPCPEKHWMIMPEMGHIIASCYGVVLILLSSVQNRCFTFFPLQIAPTFVPSHAEIAIGFCDKHFVQVLFKENHMYRHPMPPPAALLTKRKPSDFDTHQQERSREWATRYDARMKQFSSSLQPMVVSHESHENPIVLDTDSSMHLDA
ncbi:hypothetical protein ACLB2K_049980 [Fragaria x ananassa]